MKKAAAYIFLFAYIVMLIKPVTPIISDAIAHVFYYSQHMATVHYENGKMHVHQEMMKKAGEENSSKDQGLLKKSQAVDEYVSPGQNVISCFITSIKSSPIFNSSSIYDRSPGITLPPPRFI